MKLHRLRFQSGRILMHVLLWEMRITQADSLKIGAPNTYCTGGQSSYNAFSGPTTSQAPGLGGDATRKARVAPASVGCAL